MDVDLLLDHLALDGPLLAAAAADAGLNAAVPGTEWDVRQLVTHAGGVHRWAADIVTTGNAGADTEAGRAVGSGPGDAALLDWYLEAHSTLVDALRRAPAELDCFTFLPADSPLHFWARRQAHETGVHRADAQAAAGGVLPFDALFAQDGIAELLHGFAARKSRPMAAQPTLGLAATDGPSWLITLGGERIVGHPTEDVVGADATVSGSSSDLYLWLWNRPSDAVVEGDDAVATAWAQTVRVRWS